MLDLLGRPIPEDMEGHIARGALDSRWLARHPVPLAEPDEGPPVALTSEAAAPDRTSPVDEDLREELRALGCIE